MPFKRQSINHSELGSYLKKLREEKNDSLEAAAHSTGISLKYLKALEAEEFEKLPGLIYAKNFLKNYLIFLGGDIEKGMEMLNPAKAAADSKNKKNKSIAPKVIFTPRRIELGIVLLIILGVFGYFFYEARFLSAPPKLEIFYPSDNEQTVARTISVDGRAGSEAKVFVNQEPVFISADGTFKETVDLQKGLNLITIQAVNKKGKITTLERRILVQE